MEREASVAEPEKQILPHVYPSPASYLFKYIWRNGLRRFRLTFTLTLIFVSLLCQAYDLAIWEFYD